MWLADGPALVALARGRAGAEAGAISFTVADAATARPARAYDRLVSRFGVHLIQLVERREAKLTQREQRDMARDTVREKKVEEALTTWMQELRGRAYVEYREAPQ